MPLDFPQFPSLDQTFEDWVWDGSKWLWAPFPPIESPVQSVTAGLGLNGGMITDAGTIDLQTPVAIANGGTGASDAWTALRMLGYTDYWAYFYLKGIIGGLGGGQILQRVPVPFPLTVYMAYIRWSCITAASVGGELIVGVTTNTNGSTSPPNNSGIVGQINALPGVYSGQATFALGQSTILTPGDSFWAGLQIGDAALSDVSIAIGPFNRPQP